MDEQLRSRLVVVGASAGGIEALSVLVSTLPDDFPAPVVIAQHLDPHRESHLGEILSRKSTLPVRMVTDHEHIEPGVVYVVPSNHHVSITDSEIDLRVNSGRKPQPSVDLLLNSAAEAVGENLIAVILTGTGSDGAAGAAAVTKAGGTVIIQNPETAEYPGMPLSLAPSTVDIVAELDRIGHVLRELMVEVADPEEQEEKDTLKTLLEDVRERRGIDFSSYKTPTIMRRLQRRIVATNSVNIEGYYEYLREHDEEYQQLVSSFLIKVTEFFRDEELFEYLETEIVPNLIDDAREQGNQLRLWSAGCATGEEAYSLAILVCEALGDELGGFDARIFATDLDEGAISFARRGIYAPAALSNMSQEMIERYFARENGDYQVNKLVRGMIVFGEHDLAQRASFPRIDMVLSRNVLIYFTPALQKRALQLFAYSLRDEGFLVLGKAETVSPLDEFFEAEDRHQKVFRRRGSRFLMPPSLMESPTPAPRPRRPSGGRSMHRNLVPAQTREDQDRTSQTIGNFLLKLQVGAVMVDRNYHIQLINNTARRLLAIHSPATGEDLIHLLQGDAYTKLRPAIDAAFGQEDAAFVDEFAIEEPNSEESRYLRMVVHAQRAERRQQTPENVAIFINDVTDLMRERNEVAERLESVSADLEQQRSLNRRLNETNRRLDEGNQELTRLNEELQTTNEELLLSTEEAQAATEEVETLNEELQATNEELETLNEELQATIEELNTTNDDLRLRGQEVQELAQDRDRQRAGLRAILDSMDSAVLFMSVAGDEVFRNAAYEQMFGEGDPEFHDRDGHAIPFGDLPRQLAVQREEFTVEFGFTAGGQEPRWFEAVGKPFQSGESGEQGGVIVIRVLDESDSA